ncbi:MAG TPA: hypothetical protein VEQ63_10550, partial [Bryobacteraceae bacterium]|nr:hypothetical protein [Bryobacteraceae bacterium]
MQSSVADRSAPTLIQAPAQPRRISRLRLTTRILAPLAVLLYFLPLGSAGLYARFAADDMMNMYGYWHKGWGKLLVAQVHFFSGYYRPMGGIFYMPLYELFGMDPLPYRIGILALLTINAILAYITARTLTRSYVVAGLTAVLTSFHTGQFVLYFNTSQLYDVLCFTFWFGAFLYFARKRLRGEYLGWKQCAVLLALYVCSLNSKEMAVMLPILLVAFELAWWRQLPDATADRLKQRLIRGAVPIVVVGFATLAYVIGKTSGPEALSNIDAYKPVITWGRFLDSNAHYAAELFFRREHSIGRGNLLIVWAAMAYLAARYRRPYLWWGLALVIFGATPIAFIEGRGGGCLNIPAFGYALLAAALVDSLTRWFSREPVFRWVRLRPVHARALLLLICVGLYARSMHRWVDKSIAGW